MMKNLLFILLTISCLMMPGMVSANPMPGSLCESMMGGTCHRGTENCICREHQLGSMCDSVKGGTCHRGAKNCFCKEDNLPGSLCESVNGGTCHRGTKNCFCKH